MTTPLSAALAASLRAERAAKRITLAEVAASSGISLSSVKRYFKGERKVDTENLFKLAAALRISPSTLMSQAEKRIGLVEPGANLNDVVTSLKRNRA